jgi:HAD superfamily hydrolase (TIGR01509 family)
VGSIGVIFDCDGTLVDSEPLSAEAWRRSVRPYGYEIADAEMAACVGMTYPRTHAYIGRRVALPDAATFLPALTRELFALYETDLVPFADALETVAALERRADVVLAVASSSVRERLDRTLARVGLAFGVTVAGDEVEHGKPAPDIFLETARRLGLPPERCVVVEDSGPGVAAGVAAGMPTLGVTRVPGDAAKLAAASVVVERVTAEAVLALAANR